jgi:16S rRNA (uracil1498-N3)-methyltransferase
VSSGFCAAAPAVAHVFVDDGRGDIRTDAAITVEGDDGHHLQRVRRLRVGEPVTVADGLGEWRLCTVDEAGDGRVVLAPTGPLMVEPVLSPRLTVAFAPAKGDQAGTVVHQLVELGVDRVMPMTLRRSVVRWEGTRGDRALSRLRRIAREAAMQSRRARPAEVVAAEPLEVLAGHPGLVVADAGGVPATTNSVPAGDEWLILVGPEGGFDPSERALTASAARMAVGPHVLRAVTAPVAAAAALVGFRSPIHPHSGDSSDLSGPAERAQRA